MRCLRISNAAYSKYEAAKQFDTHTHMQTKNHCLPCAIMRQFFMREPFVHDSQKSIEFLSESYTIKPVQRGKE